jgi:hypothetical protein
MYLNYGSKLRLVNLVLSSLPTFSMSTLKLYQWVLDECEKYRRYCLWRNKDLNSKTPPLASWDMVCCPKAQGGLGVLNLTVQNNCLLIKHIHKFYNKDNIPWIHLVWESYYHHTMPPLRHRDISFWWGDCLKNLDLYKAKASCTLNSGETVLLWTDLWSTEVLSTKWPYLFTFARDITISVKKVILTEEITSLYSSYG